MDAMITRNPEVMHGTPCFAGTRIPVDILFDYLDGNSSVGEFLEQYPSLSRERVMALLRMLRDHTNGSAVEVRSEAVAR